MSGEKTLEPTEHKLQEARKKGQVPVSKDLAHCLTVGLGMELAFALEKLARKKLAELFDLALRGSHNNFETIFSNLLIASGTILLVGMVIFAISNIVLSLFGYWGQFGVLFSATPITPDFNKLNPVTNVKNIVSERKLMETLLAVGKLLVFGLVTYLLTRSELPAIVTMAGGDPPMAYAATVDILHGLFRILIGISIFLAVIDLFVQRRAHTKQNRMNFEEMFREYKELEGDPWVKGERKALARSLATSDPVSKTEGANAVVVNPTHFAVAMLFDPKSKPVPVICAKGRDEVARAMIQRAHDKGIPVIRHVWLARTLYATAKEDRPIPRPLFDPVALVYSVIEQMKEQGGSYLELDSSEQPPRNI